MNDDFMMMMIEVNEKLNCDLKKANGTWLFVFKTLLTLT